MANRGHQPARQNPPSTSQRAASQPQVSVSHTTELSYYQGPLPAPEIIAAYDALVPNGAERIFVIFEEQARHRMQLEKTVIEADMRRADRGLNRGTLVAITGLVVACILGVTGHEVAAGVIAAVDLVGLVTAFIYGTNSRQRERVQKAQTPVERGS